MSGVVRQQRKKISLNLPPVVERMLGELVDKTGLNQSEVIQSAIRIQYFLAEEVSKGRRIYSLDEDGGNPSQLVLGIDLLEKI